MTTKHITLSKFIGKYEHRLYKGTERHINDQVSKLRRFQAFEDLADTDLRDIGLEDLDNFMDHLNLHGLAVSTQNRHLAAITPLFKLAQNYDYIEKRPKTSFKKERVREHRYTPEQVDEMIKYLLNNPPKGKLPWIGWYFIVGINTGMRRHEVTSIKRETVTEDLSHAYLWKTKNGKPRKVKLNEQARDAVRLLLDNDVKFVSATFYRHWNRMREALLKKGVFTPEELEDCVFHTTRHTTASNLVNYINANLAHVSEILGHSDIKTTMKYVHPDSNEVDTHMERLSKLNALAS